MGRISMYFGATTHVHTSFFRIYMHGWNAVPMTMTISQHLTPIRQCYASSMYETRPFHIDLNDELQQIHSDEFPSLWKPITVRQI